VVTLAPKVRIPGRLRSVGRTVRVFAAALAQMLTIVGAALALTVGTLVIALDASVAPVLSASMRPAFAEGDLLVVRPVDTATLEVGQVVLLAGPGMTTGVVAPGVVAHRIVALEPAGDAEDGLLLHTRGDANEAPDPGPVLVDAPRTEVVVGRVPALGHVVIAIDGAGARAVLSAAVIALVALAALRMLRGRRGSQRVRTAQD
jgi:signal peptidase I